MSPGCASSSSKLSLAPSITSSSHDYDTPVTTTSEPQQVGSMEHAKEHPSTQIPDPISPTGSSESTDSDFDSDDGDKVISRGYPRNLRNLENIWIPSSLDKT